MSDTFTLVTGASSGFGRSIALKLAASRRLVLAGRDTEKLDAVRKTCAHPDRHRIWSRDLTRVEGIGDDLAAWLSTNQVTIDHFVHSAGTTGIQLARATDMEFVSRVFNVNVFA